MLFLLFIYLFLLLIVLKRFLYRKITVLQTMLNATANQLIQIKNIDKLQIKQIIEFRLCHVSVIQSKSLLRK